MYGQEPIPSLCAIAATSKAACILSLEEFRGAIEHESDLGLLSTLRDELNSRCRKLEQDACNKGESNKRRYTSMSESDSDDASTCSTRADKRRCTSMSDSDSDAASTCITIADGRRCISMSESDSDAVSTCITMASTSTEVDPKADPLTSIQNLPTVGDFGLFGPRSSKNLKGRSIGRELGRGRFATVFSTSSPGGRNEALKVISKKEVDAADDWTNIANEYDALSNLGPHPNIVCLTEAMQSAERIYFFMDFAEGQELFDFIKSRQQCHVAEEAIQLISKSILSALAHCHGQGTCHRDVKPENIIVQQDYSAKLVDFGCAFPRHQPQGPRCIGTLPFIAPECLNGQSIDAAPADVWSFGAVVLEMTFGLNALSRFLGWKTYALPAFGECGGQLTTLFADPSQALEQIRSKLGAKVASKGDDVLARMLHADPSQRPSAEALL